MNILEPLYESCLMRMRGFVGDEDRENAANKKSFGHKYKFFRKVLEETQNEQHPNLQYFIYKSIILRNLYGVDIMKEAVEIAKLRLFLKLVATVEVDYRKPNLGLEPLPDIDFNIRAGNTLVGFATEAELNNAFTGKLDFDNDTEKIKEKCDIVARAFERYKTIQLNGEASNYAEFKSAKDNLNQRLSALNHELNIILCKEQGIIYDKNSPAILKSYESWFRQYLPFHWFAEFYEIIQGKGGFDVIIGNPPYVEYKGIGYNLIGYKTIECGNLYAFVMERSKDIMKTNGFCGMIVPMSGHSTERMSGLVKYFYNYFQGNYIFNISADAHPSMLFDGVKFRLAIFINSNSFGCKYVSKFARWYAEEREYLFNLLAFNKFYSFTYKDIIPKISDPTHLSILIKLMSGKSSFLNVGSHKTFYHNTPIHWIRAHDFIPYFHSERDGEKASTQLKAIFYNNKIEAEVASTILCSSLFFIWWITISDCYHLNKPELANFKFDYSDNPSVKKLYVLYDRLKKDLIENSVRRVYNYKTSGRVEYDEFYMKKSKSIIDEIDTILAEHYGFTDEELDFIINYDIKYRMGRELENEEGKKYENIHPLF